MISLFGPPEPTLLERLKDSVSKTKTELSAKVEQLLTGDRPVDPELLRQLESALLSADIGVRTTKEVLAALRQQVNEHKLVEAKDLKRELKNQISKILTFPPRGSLTGTATPQLTSRPVRRRRQRHRKNHHHRQALESPEKRRRQRDALSPRTLFAPPRSNSSKSGARRSGVEVIKQKSGADPSAVIFDALSAAAARKVDAVIVDTAGRLHTKSNLMAELEKMKRTAAKIVPGAPHDVLLVLDATTGQNGLNQAREFWSHAGVTGIVLTKLDGTAKGGIVVAIAHELNLPIRFVGTGEQIDDLVPFDPQTYVNSLFD